MAHKTTALTRPLSLGSLRSMHSAASHAERYVAARSPIKPAVDLNFLRIEVAHLGTS
jgi:hypothetical protein